MVYYFAGNGIGKGEKKMEFRVDKNTIISDILMKDMDTAEYFMQVGMHCIYCPASMGETLEEACMVHGIEPDDLIETLNEHFSAIGGGDTEAAEEKNEG